jgi:hypothetical protein
LYCPNEPIYFFGFENEKEISSNTLMYISTISGLLYYKPKYVTKDLFFEISMGRAQINKNDISMVTYNSLAISCIGSKTILVDSQKIPCVVTADLSGKALVFAFQKADPGYKLIGEIIIEGALRAIAIKDLGNGEGLCMFGTLDGKIGGFKFNPIESFVESFPSIWLTGVASGIITLKWLHFPDFGKTQRQCQYSNKCTFYKN